MRPPPSLPYLCADDRSCTPACLQMKEKKKNNHNIFSSRLRADQMLGLPRKVQVMYELFLDRHIIYLSIDHSRSIFV